MLGNVPFAELITFTRASPAWRFNASGILVQDGNNVPRFDYDPVTLQARGMLVEEGRTNYALWCRDLTNAAWVKTGCTAAKTAIGLDGASNAASTLTATAANATCLQSITRASAQRITGLYIRRRSGSGVINMTQNGGATWTPVTVTGVFTQVSLPAATAANPNIGLQIATSGDAIDVDFVSHEEGAFLTSPILTTTAATARSADLGVISDLSEIGFNAIEGTFVVDTQGYQPGAKYSFGVTDGTANNMIGLSRQSGGILQSRVTVGGVVASLGVSSNYAGEQVKVGLTYGQGSHTACMNGGTVLSIASGVPVVNQMRVGAVTTTGQINGWLRSIRYYPRKLLNAELQALTA
ncbi:hypothetical protein C7414_102375 [Cupriavidus alkaliphilus]|uniref:phage head spike fiber domain-containing protein n=1 Tax=Cupriavidus alkaliphilus TaxID=942866 RepID=UPI000DE65E92|nr:hypothetical protein [Cupriavidus alkaliphilus]PVY81047.1 hypothetical protein C7414_102375 [Cupriavidus alkaliphilus]